MGHFSLLPFLSVSFVKQIIRTTPLLSPLHFYVHDVTQNSSSIGGQKKVTAGDKQETSFLRLSSNKCDAVLCIQNKPHRPVS